MNRKWLLPALMMLCFIATAVVFFGFLLRPARGQTPVPSYELPRRGTITQVGPDGISTTVYDRHGRDYWTLGPNGFSMQQQRGNNILRLEPWGDGGVNTFNKAMEDLRGGTR